jgi:hypothetical protein
MTESMLNSLSRWPLSTRACVEKAAPPRLCRVAEALATAVKLPALADMRPWNDQATVFDNQ